MFNSMYKNAVRLTCCSVLTVACLSSTSQALTVPFTEDFTAGSSQWFTDSSGTMPPIHSLTGGPDGGPFVSHSFNFLNLQPSDTPLFFRGQATFDSSGDAFVGDWLANDVAELSAWVRHDGSSRLNFFVRLAPAGGAGVVGISPLISSGVWTKITFPLMSSAFLNEGPPGAGFFNGVISNIGNVQFGALPGSMTGVDQLVSFDLDKVRIVPEPATMILLAGGGLLIARRVRKDRHS